VEEQMTCPTKQYSGAAALFGAALSFYLPETRTEDSEPSLILPVAFTRLSPSVARKAFFFWSARSMVL
jgi:hypothetical protein